MSETRLLKFPADYPIKVVGRAAAGLREEIDAIVARHAPDFDLRSTVERLSENGRFVSLTYRIRAESAAQVEALGAELVRSRSVLLVF
ncbi:MAG: YbeD family protein [Steroidobacteraceae bacterium]